MTCEEILKVVSRHPSEATPEQRFRVAQHVVKCASCRFMLEMADDTNESFVDLAKESQQWADSAGETLREKQ